MSAPRGLRLAPRQDLLLDLAADPSVARRLAGDGAIPAAAAHDGTPAATAARLSDLRAAGARGTLRLLRGRRYERCVVLVNDFRAQGRWMSVVGLALAARARRRVLVDPAGAQRDLTLGSALAREVPFAARRALTTAGVLARTWALAGRIRPAGPLRPIVPRRVLFVRADLSRLDAGGSLAHIAGVIGGLEAHGHAVTFLTPEPVRGFDEDGVRVHRLAPDPRYALSQELPALAYNHALAARVTGLLGADGPDLVYHRYSLGSCGAALAAQRAGRPLVVEFNGSEVWIARHWGHGLRFGAAFARVERAVLRAADLVVAVSEPLREQLHAAGVPDERILVNPNGVDASRFDPDDPALAAAARDERARLGFGADEVAFAFVGTFGPWHGAESLAEAIVRLPPSLPARFLFIGDGPRRAASEAVLARAGLLATRRAVFTGMVPQDRAPALLVACDVCVSPHVPNPDGTAFFGSPTKLFEYLATGRPVVASALGQIGDVLEHDRSALLVPPGDVDALAAALLRIGGDAALRARLGAAGRAAAVERHSWRAHVARILARLASPDPGGPAPTGKKVAR